MRRRIPFAITFRRPRKIEDAPPARPKRAPITALWDEMVSGAPVDLATPDMNAETLLEERTWDGWAVEDDVTESPHEWNGWAVSDDPGEADSEANVTAELVIRHVHGRTGPVLAVPFVQFSAVQPRTRVPSGIYVVPLSTEIEQLDDTREDTEWDEPSERVTMPIPHEAFRPTTSVTPRPPRGRWPQVHVAIATLGLLLIVAAWRHSPTIHAAEQTADMATPIVASESAPIVQAEPAHDPTPTPAPRLAALIVEAPAQPPAPAAPAADAPLFAAAWTPETPQFAATDAAPVTTRHSAADPDFDYRSARRYIDEQASYLRETCMHKGARPRDRLRVEVAVQPGGVARIAVPGASAEVRGCVRRVLAFPFDPSPRGAQFVYTLTATRSHLKPRGETTTG